MAKNRRRANGRKLSVNVSALNGSGAGNLVKSGDPGALGSGNGLAFVALTDEDGSGLATVDTKGVYDLPVNAWDPAGPAGDAVAALDELYWDNAAGLLRPVPAAGIPAGGKFFGIALEAVAAAADADDVVTVEVRVGR